MIAPSACSATMQGPLTTTDHVLVETWAVARSRRNRTTADALLETILGRNLSEILTATPDDIRMALRIGELFSDRTHRWSTGQARPPWNATASRKLSHSTRTSLCTATAPACEELSSCIADTQTTRAENRTDRTRFRPDQCPVSGYRGSGGVWSQIAAG